MMRARILPLLAAALLAGCAADSGGGRAISVVATADGQLVVKEGRRQHLLPLTETRVNDVKLLLSSEQNGFRYLLFDVTRGPASCPEVSTLWLKIDSAWRVVSTKSALHDSCKSGLHTDTDHYALTEKHLWMSYSGGGKVYTLTYDSTYPDVGFVLNEEPAR